MRGPGILSRRKGGIARLRWFGRPRSRATDNPGTDLAVMPPAEAEAEAQESPSVKIPAPAHLWAEGMVKVYRGRAVVNGISVGVNRGEVVGLLGPNGAGKTTIFYMIVGLIRPDGGRVILDGEDITLLPMHQRALRGLGYLAQNPSIFRRLTVWENIMAILEIRGVPVEEREERCQNLLERLHVDGLREQRGESLSGGEQRRVEIARALAASPSFILLDEPFTGVDPMAVQDIQRIIAELRSDGIGIVITDQNVRETLAITDRAHIISDGLIRVAGTPSELIENEIARQFYFGETFDRRLPNETGAD